MGDTDFKTECVTKASGYCTYMCPLLSMGLKLLISVQCMDLHMYTCTYMYAVCCMLTTLKVALN